MFHEKLTMKERHGKSSITKDFYYNVNQFSKQHLNKEPQGYGMQTKL